MDDRIVSIEARLVRLQKRQWLLFAIVLALTTVAIYMDIKSYSAQVAEPSKELRASKFVLVDADGPNGTSVALIDGNGKLRAVLSAEQQALTIFDTDGRRRVLLDLMDDGSRFSLIGREDQPAVALGYSDGIGANLALFDKSHEARIGIGVFQDNTPLIVITDSDGESVWQAP